MASKRLIADTEAAAAFLALMANEKRLSILSQLVDDELSVGIIAERVSLSQSALSQHLAKLRSFGLVETRRDRQMIYYSCRSREVLQLLGLLATLFDSSGRKAAPLHLDATGT